MLAAVTLALLCAVHTDALPQAAPVATAPPASVTDPIDLAALDRIVGDAEFVVLGEDSHRMPAVHELVGVVFRHLVEEKGFRNFVLETYWGVEEVLNGFLASDRAQPNQQETHFLNAFASEATTRLLLWARAYNQAHSSDPVRFTGYHAEQPVTDAIALRAFAAQASALNDNLLESALAACDLAPDTYANDVALLVAHSKRRQNKQQAYAPEARIACLQGLGAIDADMAATRHAIERQTSPAAVEEAGLHVSSLRFFVQRASPASDAIVVAMLAGQGMEKNGQVMQNLYLHADRVRFEIFETLQRARDRRGKTFLWMHNWHAARQADTIEFSFGGARGHAVSFGERLSKRYGDNVVILGNIVPCEDCGEPAGSLEPAFAKRLGRRAAVINLKDPAAIAGLPVHVPGKLFPQFHKEMPISLDNVVLDANFDGILYLPDAERLP